MGKSRLGILGTLGPGILVAATGVGAGDIATASFAGSALGYAILWAVVLGAFIKFVINEGLARWQLATGQTLLEGSVLHFGRVVQWLFLIYLLIWSWGVGSALISACGVAAHALVPVFDDPRIGKVVWGVAHSVVAVALILIGGFRRFEKVMMTLLLVMFVTVIAAAVMVKPDWSAVVRGLVVPRIPTDVGADAGLWTLALMGGVGGTLTMLCYGYWIREQGRGGIEFLRTCRIDLGVSYTVTAIFGLAMVIIGTGLNLGAGGGAAMMIKLADRLGETLGTPMRWAFLAGAWAAVFTSMLGVWQAVPYLFCDFWQLFTRSRAKVDLGSSLDSRAPAPKSDQSRPPVLEYSSVTPADAVDTRSWTYRGYLFALAFVPMLGLQFSFVYIQKTYSLLGAVVMPMIALALLILNGRGALVGREYRNHPITVLVLLAILTFFAYAAYVTFTTGRDVVA